MAREFMRRMRDALFGVSMDDSELGRLQLHRQPAYRLAGDRIVKESSYLEKWLGAVWLNSQQREIGISFIIGSREGPTKAQRLTTHLIDHQWRELY